MEKLYTVLEDYDYSKSYKLWFKDYSVVKAVNNALSRFLNEDISLPVETSKHPSMGNRLFLNNKKDTDRLNDYALFQLLKTIGFDIKMIEAWEKYPMDDIYLKKFAEDNPSENKYERIVLNRLRETEMITVFENENYIFKSSCSDGSIRRLIGLPKRYDIWSKDIWLGFCIRMNSLGLENIIVIEESEDGPASVNNDSLAIASNPEEAILFVSYLKKKPKKPIQLTSDQLMLKNNIEPFIDDLIFEITAQDKISISIKNSRRKKFEDLLRKTLGLQDHPRGNHEGYHSYYPLDLPAWKCYGRGRNWIDLCFVLIDLGLKEFQELLQELDLEE